MIYKVQIKKERKVIIVRGEPTEATSFIYPEGYDKTKLSPFIYQSDGLDTEYCLATGDIEVSEGIEEVTNAEAEVLIENWVTSDKDIIDERLTKEGMTREEIINQKKSNLTS